MIRAHVCLCVCSAPRCAFRISLLVSEGGDVGGGDVGWGF